MTGLTTTRASTAKALDDGGACIVSGSGLVCVANMEFVQAAPASRTTTGSFPSWA